MESRFLNYRFSTHFNRLTYLGMWPVGELPIPITKKLFLLYRAFVYGLLLTSICLQMMDLYLGLGNLKKVTFNFCTSLVTVGFLFKLLLLYDRKNNLNELRLDLWQDSLLLNSEEDVALQDIAYTQLKYIRHWFYTMAILFPPMTVGFSYFSYLWGPRQLPFAGYLPISDPMNDKIFVPALLFEAVCAVCIIFVIVETELSTFSLILQMNAYYEIFIKNIKKLSDIYKNEDDEEENKPLKPGSRKNTFIKEVNVYMMNEKAKKLLKTFVNRYLELLEYSKKFEFIFSRCMFLQIFGGSCVVIINGLELTLYFHELSMKYFFQMTYIAMAMLDLLFLCYHLSRHSSHCDNVGVAAYSTLWYKMNADMRKRLYIFMIRSNKPPRITAGKLVIVDLNTYLNILRNIYSWLMLIRQIFGT